MLGLYSIRIRHWAKENRQQILLTILVFFIALISFGLGYITARDFSVTPIVIQKYSD